jgi:hypothetical protein
MRFETALFLTKSKTPRSAHLAHYLPLNPRFGGLKAVNLRLRIFPAAFKQ